MLHCYDLGSIEQSAVGELTGQYSWNVVGVICNIQRQILGDCIHLSVCVNNTGSTVQSLAAANRGGRNKDGQGDVLGLERFYGDSICLNKSCERYFIKKIVNNIAQTSQTQTVSAMKSLADSGHDTAIY